MKLSGFAIKAVGLAVLAVLLMVPFVNSCDGGEITVNDITAVPPIDTMRPAEIATATFAMG